MAKIRSSADLSAHLNEGQGQTVRDLTGMGITVETLMNKWPNNRGIYLQLQRLSDFIHKTREELSGLQPNEVKQSFIPTATDELDAIVEATAAATHRIMDAADVIMEVAGALPKDQADRAMAAATSIFEACTFQDITGQRVTKIVNVLKVIEARIDKMVGALGELGPAPPVIVAEGAVQSSQGDIDALFAPPPSGGSVLSGPALPGRAPTQAEIDALLAGNM